MKDRTLIVSLIITMFLWGSLYPFSKLIMSSINPLTLAFLRNFFGILPMVPFYFYAQKRDPVKINLKDIFTISVLGFIGITGFAVLLFYGIDLSTSINGAILVNTQPIITVLLAPVMIGEKFSSGKLSGAFVGLAGMYLVITRGMFININLSNNMLMGNILLILAALSMCFYSILLKKYILKYGSFIPTFFSMLSGVILLFIIVLFADKGLEDIKKLNNAKDIFLIIYLGLFATALPYLLFNNALKHLTLIKATGYKFLIPVSGTALSLLFLKERPGIITYSGVILVLLSILLIQKLGEPLNNNRDML